MLLTILFAFLTIGLLGGLLGTGLAFASRALAVKKDERLEELEAALPGINCGACGYAGCASYAEAISNDDEELTLCAPGGPTTAEELGRIMGKEVDLSAARRVTQVHCRGGSDVSEYLFEYEGLEDCNALYLLYGGDKVCKSSCLGLGSCIRVCPVGAIDYDDEGKVWVDKELCISCGKCIDACPTGVMKWVPYDADYIIACSNTDPAKVVRKICKVGCIACSMCAKKSPEGGYVIDNNLCAIDYTISGDRVAGAEKCPPKCIIRVGGDLHEQGETVESSDQSDQPAVGSVAAPQESSPAAARRNADEED